MKKQKKRVIRLIDAAIYEENELLGVANVEVGEISYLTDEVSGFGVGGSIDLPTTGQFDSVEITINWPAICEPAIKLAKPKYFDIQIRGALQVIGLDEVMEPDGIVISYRGMPKKFAPGKFERASTMDASNTFEAIYLKMEYNDNTLMEIDKLSRKALIDGDDSMAAVKNILEG